MSSLYCLFCWFVCMGSLCHFILASCTLRKWQMSTMTAPLLLINGPVRYDYEAVLHLWDKPDGGDGS